MAALERERATAGANNNRLVQQCRAARSQCEADLAATLDEVFQTDVTPEAIVLTVPGDVLFDFDTHTIRADAEEALRLAGLYIDQHPRSDIVIEGHTDSIGASDYNLALSQRRARAVAAWLTENAGVSGERLATLGLGESEPVAPETDANGTDDPAARQRNRRVEILIQK